MHCVSPHLGSDTCSTAQTGTPNLTHSRQTAGARRERGRGSERLSASLVSPVGVTKRQSKVLCLISHMHSRIPELTQTRSNNRNVMRITVSRPISPPRNKDDRREQAMLSCLIPYLPLHICSLVTAWVTLALQD